MNMDLWFYENWFYSENLYRLNRSPVNHIFSGIKSMQQKVVNYKLIKMIITLPLNLIPFVNYTVKDKLCCRKGVTQLLD
jgi:hypothetical protein